MKIVLTHDIDSIKKPFSHIWQRRNRFSRWDIVLSALHIRNLYNNIEDIIALEDKYGYKSTFFVPVFLFDITEIVDTLKEIKKEGWEVQLHFVYESIQPQGLFKLQKDFFEKHIGELYGLRSHMLFINDFLLDLFEKEGLLYDASFRAETVNSYNPFNIRNNLVEIPLALMDADIFGRFKFSENTAWKYIMWKLKSAEKENADCFVVLFHQEAYRMKGGRLYKKFVEYISSQDYETQLCIDAAKSIKEHKK